ILVRAVARPIGSGSPQNPRSVHEVHQNLRLTVAVSIAIPRLVPGAGLRPDGRYRETARTDRGPAETARPAAAGARIRAEGAGVRTEIDRFPAEAAGPPGCRAAR